MATFNSDKINSGVSKLLPLGYNQSILATAAVTTAFTTNDTCPMVRLEGNPSAGTSGGLTIQAITLGSDDLDSGTALTLDVGDSGSAARFISQSTIGQTGGVAGGTLAPCLGYQPFASPFYDTYTTASLAFYTVVVKNHLVAGTPVAGNIRLLVSFNVDP